MTPLTTMTQEMSFMDIQTYILQKTRITYYPTASVFVGVVDKSSAESYPAHPDMEAYPEMRTEEGMTGIAITTETPLELKSGEKYTFSVTIMNAFICEFEMTIK